MSMSTHVIGIKPPDETWHKMKAVWDNCIGLSIPVPRAVIDYFEGAPPDPDGVRVQVPCNDWFGDAEQGIEVLLAEVPKHVTVLRFYNSW